MDLIENSPTVRKLRNNCTGHKYVLYSSVQILFGTICALMSMQQVTERVTANMIAETRVGF